MRYYLIFRPDGDNTFSMVVHLQYIMSELVDLPLVNIDELGDGTIEILGDSVEFGYTGDVLGLHPGIATKVLPDASGYYPSHTVSMGGAGESTSSDTYSKISDSEVSLDLSQYGDDVAVRFKGVIRETSGGGSVSARLYANGSGQTVDSVSLSNVPVAGLPFTSNWVDASTLSTEEDFHIDFRLDSGSTAVACVIMLEVGLQLK